MAMLTNDLARRYASKRTDIKLSDDYYNKINRWARASAFTISRVGDVDLIKKMKADLDLAQSAGMGFVEFKEKYKDKDIFNQLSESHFELIFRNYTNTAYAFGKCEGFYKNKERRPFLKYVAIDDKRLRASHKKLNGIIRRIDDPIWQMIMPPNGHNCRCTVVSLTEKQANALSVDENIDEINSAIRDIKDTEWDYSVCSDSLKYFRNQINDKAYTDISFIDELKEIANNFYDKDIVERINNVKDTLANNNKLVDMIEDINSIIKSDNEKKELFNLIRTINSTNFNVVPILKFYKSVVDKNTSTLLLIQLLTKLIK